MAEKMTLKDYLLTQGVPGAMINRLAAFRKTYGKPEDTSRIRPPKTMFIDAYKDSSGKIVSKGVLRKALATVLAGDNLLLIGEKGSGKNTLADTLAFLCGRPIYECQMHVHADAETLLGKDTFRPVPVEREIVVGVDKAGAPIKTTVIERQGEVHFNIAQYAESGKVGGFAVVDEVNMTRAEAIAVLNSTLDDRRRIDIPGYGMLDMHPAARVIATMNHGYAGTQELNEALQDRFVPVEVPAMSAEEISEFFSTRFAGIHKELAKQLGLLFHDMLGRVNAQDLSGRCVSLRGLIQGTHLIQQGLTVHEALSTTIAGRTFDAAERKTLQQLVDTRIPKSWTPEWAISEME